jgi:hypothetical protein
MTAVSRALWHRHWMELRGGLTVAASVAALLCFVFPALVGIGIEDHEWHGRTSPWLRAAVDRRDALGLETFAAWGAHVATAALASIVLGLFLSGTGLRTNSLTPGHPSLAYTLTLPVSRGRLIVTRFAASAAAAVAIFGSMLAINAAVLWAAGWPVPLGDMARTTALATTVVLAVMATVGGPLTVWNEVAGGTAFTLGLIAVIFIGWSPLVAVVTSDAHAAVIGAAAVAVLGSLALSSAIAARKDF